MKEQIAMQAKREMALKETEVDNELLLLQIATGLRSSRVSSWEVGAAANELANRGYTDDTIAQMVTEHGVPVERSTINLYRLNYEFYVVTYGFKPEELLKWTLRQVSAIRRIVSPYNVSRDTLEQILKRSLGKTIRETAEIAAKAVGKHNNTESEFKQVSLPTPVAEHLKEFTNYLQGIADATGHNGIVTQTVAIEFAMAVIEAFDREALMRLWQEAHGEATEEDYDGEDY